MRLLIGLPLLTGCYWDALVRTPEPYPAPTCYANLYIYRVDPVTKARIDSSWAGTMEVPCPKER